MSSSSTESGASGPSTDRLEVGRITKPHGIGGDLLVVLTTDRTDRLNPGSVLYTDRGELVVEASRRHTDRFIVTFGGVRGRDRADELRGTVLLADPVDSLPGEHFAHEVIGLTVVEASGISRGTVTGVLDNPAADILVLDTGALVPMSFVTDIADQIVIDPPAGLFDL